MWRIVLISQTSSLIINTRHISWLWRVLFIFWFGYHIIFNDKMTIFLIVNVICRDNHKPFNISDMLKSKHPTKHQYQYCRGNQQPVWKQISICMQRYGINLNMFRSTTAMIFLWQNTYFITTAWPPMRSWRHSISWWPHFFSGRYFRAWGGLFSCQK